MPSARVTCNLCGSKVFIKHTVVKEMDVPRGTAGAKKKIKLPVQFFWFNCPICGERRQQETISN